MLRFVNLIMGFSLAGLGVFMFIQGDFLFAFIDILLGFTFLYVAYKSN